MDIGSHHGTWRINVGSEPSRIAAGKCTPVFDGDTFKFGKVVSKANQVRSSMPFLFICTYVFGF